MDGARPDEESERSRVVRKAKGGRREEGRKRREAREGEVEDLKLEGAQALKPL